MAISATELPIINEALTKVGQRRITAAQLATPDNKASNLAVDTYENHRDQLLEDHPWNFAIERASIVKESTTPIFDFNYEYAYPDGTTPADKLYALRILKINDDLLWAWGQWGWIPQPGFSMWKSEGRKILSNIDTPLEVRYIGRVTTYATMSAMFKDLLAQKLAMEWAEPLTGSTALGTETERRFTRKLGEARSIDGQEGIPDPIETSSWLMERFT